MNYRFQLKTGEELRVFYNSLFEDKVEKTHGTVTFWKGSGNTHKEYVRTVRIDDNGRRFFTWNKEKIFMDEFLALTPGELVEKYQNNDPHVNSDDICNTLQKYGMDSLLLFIKEKPLERVLIGDIVVSFKVESNMDKDEDKTWIAYRFMEDYLRMPEDGYKLKLVPADPELYDCYPKQDYYVSDLNGLISRCKDSFRLDIPA